MIIGLSGYARSGKDSVADILVREAGFIRVAFADKLRQAVYELDPTVISEYSVPHNLQWVIDQYGWDGVKNTGFGPEVRRLLQRMGTEVGRTIFDEDFWVEAATKDLLTEKKYVFTDCRFDNEARRIQWLNGKVWRVTRPGVEPANDHISEIGLDNWPFDAIILNDGSLEDLREKVLTLEETARRV